MGKNMVKLKMFRPNHDENNKKPAGISPAG